MLQQELEIKVRDDGRKPHFNKQIILEIVRAVELLLVTEHLVYQKRTVCRTALILLADCHYGRTTAFGLWLL